MSDSLKRKINAYPRPNIYNKLVEKAQKQGVSQSSIVCEALKEYFAKDIKKK